MKKDTDPSKPLINPKQEQFVQNYISGMDATNAYIKAGYSDKNGSSACASRLLRAVNVSKRMNYLKDCASTGKVMTRRRAMEILTEIIETDLSDFLTVDVDGVQHFKFDKETMKRKALKKCKTKTQRDEHGNIVAETMFQEMELESKTAALERLAKMMGWDEAKKIRFEEEHDAATKQEQIKMMKALTTAIETGNMEAVFAYTIQSNNAIKPCAVGDAAQPGQVGISETP
jgi:phage terminase small subunit